jgi:hypothetical protein
MTRHLRLLLFTVLAVAGMLALGFAAHWLWQRYNPFWDRSREYREANALGAAIHRRPLTDAEFARSLELCETGPFRARGAGVSLIEEAVKQNPERGARAVEVLTRVSQSSDPELRSYAAAVLRQLKNQVPAQQPVVAPPP